MGQSKGGSDEVAERERWNINEQRKEIQSGNEL